MCALVDRVRQCIYIYIYICMCICMHRCIYIYVCIYMYIYMCVCFCSTENNNITCKKLSKEKKTSNIQLNFETKRLL